MLYPSNYVDPKKLPMRVIIWFRDDLRLYDNPIVNWATEQAIALKKQMVEVVPVFCFDPRFFMGKRDKFSTRRTGIRRTHFMIETVMELR